jgi:plastocyanin
MKGSSKLVLGSAFAVLALLAGCGEEKAAAPAPAPAPAGAPATAAAPAAPAGGGGAFDPAAATATISIKATAKGKLPPMRPIKFDSDPICGEAHKGVDVPEQTILAADGKLANVIVWVSKGAEKWTFAVPKDAVVIDQKGCMYNPHVLTLMVNQPILIRNSDALMHNIHAVPNNQEEFNHSQLKGSRDLNEKFKKEEVGLRIKCDVHNWMGAWAGVFTHTLHGVTGADGGAKIKVPAGEFEISAWHEFDKFSKPAAQKVTVAAGETKEIEFVFEVK